MIHFIPPRDSCILGEMLLVKITDLFLGILDLAVIGIVGRLDGIPCLLPGESEINRLFGASLVLRSGMGARKSVSSSNYLLNHIMPLMMQEPIVCILYTVYLKGFL